MLQVFKSKKAMTYPMTIAIFIAILMLFTAILFLINAKLILRQAAKNMQVALDSYAVQRAIDAEAATPDGSGNMFNQIKNQDNTDEHGSTDTVVNRLYLDSTMIRLDKFLGIASGHFGYTNSGSILLCNKKNGNVYYKIHVKEITTTGNNYELKLTFRVEVPFNSLWSKKMDAEIISNLNWKDEGMLGTGW